MYVGIYKPILLASFNSQNHLEVVEASTINKATYLAVCCNWQKQGLHVEPPQFLNEAEIEETISGPSMPPFYDTYDVT